MSSSSLISYYSFSARARPSSLTSIEATTIASLSYAISNADLADVTDYLLLTLLNLPLNIDLYLPDGLRYYYRMPVSFFLLFTDPDII